MRELTSTRNPRVQQIVALHRSRGRRDARRHLVEGPHAVEAAAAAGLLDEVLVTAEVLPQLKVPSDVSVAVVSEHVMERISDARTPQGIVAVARTPHVALAELPTDGLLVVLDHVAEPGNAGTIVRTADAAGASGLALSARSADVFAPKAIRAAAGSTYHLPIATGAAIEDIVSWCRASGRRVVGLDGRAETSVFGLADDAHPLALVLGSEAHGLSAAVRDGADELASVPVDGHAESLNVAAAAAVAIYAAAHRLHRSS